jgi:hypothetical protein
MRRYIRSVAGLILILTIFGCRSSSRETVVVQGEVTFAGKPVEKGTIEFRPIEGTNGPLTTCSIVNGKYTVPGDKWGLLPTGVYEVRILGMRKTGRLVKLKLPMPKDSGPPPEEEENYIPAAYNAQTTLKLRVADVPDRTKVDFQLR